MLCKLQAEYAARFSGQTPVLYKLKEIWAYLGQGLYQEQGKLVKKIMKCHRFKLTEAHKIEIQKEEFSKILPYFKAYFNLP